MDTPINPSIAASGGGVNADAAQIAEEQYQVASTIYRSEGAADILCALLRFARVPFRRASLGLIESLDPDGVPMLGLEGEVSPTWNIQERVIAEGTPEALHPGGDMRLLASYPAYDALSALEMLQVEDIEQDPFLTPEERVRLREAGTAGLIIVPLVAVQRLVGLIEIEQAQAAPLPALRMRALRRLADQAAVVFQNRALLDSAARRAVQLALQVRVLEIVNRLASNIGTFVDARALFDYVAGAMREAMKIDHVGIILLEPGVDYGLLISESPPQLPPGTHLDMENNPLLEAMKQDLSTPYIISNTRTDSRVLPDTRTVFERLGIRSIMLTPVVIEGRLVASVGFDSYQEARLFSIQDSQLAATMSAQLAIGLQNIRLLQAAERRTQEATRRATSEALINTVTEKMQRTQDVSVMVDAALHELGRALGARRARARFLTPEDSASSDAVSQPHEETPDARMAR